MAHRKFLSPAKVNLILRVLGKREDGYHEIFSLMQPVSLHDEVIIDLEEGSSITVNSDSSEVPAGRDNLAWRAAEVFLQKVALKRKVSINIVKRIPVGGGLGGGSGDAATVLTGLNEMLSTGVTEKELMEWGASIGSDVPFFILKGPCTARGRGEVLERVKLPAYHYVLVNPGFGISTAWAYGNLGLTKKFEDNILTYSVEDFAEPEKLKGLIVNDLEEAVLGKFPVISEIKDLLIKEGAFGSLMSGSGPTVFGIFLTGDTARRAYENLKGKPGGFSIFLVRGL